MALLFFKLSETQRFKQDNAPANVAGIVRIFLDMENVWILSWPTRLPDLPPIESVYPMVAEHLDRHHKSVTAFDALCYRVEVAWTSVLIHALQSLNESIPRRISVFISVRDGCSRY
ncbi:hypothetical protein TNCV_3714881 [Trichonephila clavipes]|nr:hypothetical protein TNCV_3714881 [Trichonephila clavipes]